MLQILIPCIIIKNIISTYLGRKLQKAKFTKNIHIQCINLYKVHMLKKLKYYWRIKF